MKQWRVLWYCLCAVVLLLAWTVPAWAFCGFYVAKADTSLFNKASQVVIARDGDRTVVTMANDVQTKAKDFAMVVPVPTVLQRDQVHVGNAKIIERLDAFSAPRLVEYYDSDPCPPPAPQPAPEPIPGLGGEEELPGVKVAAQFSVDEYEIVILDAAESNSLRKWLVQNGYKIPKSAEPLFQPYIRQKMKFFVVKVNEEKFAKSGYQFLRPLQIAYESSQFMLPIRLGMINAQNVQDLVIYILTPKGQAEVTNYRTVNIPTDEKVPLYIKDEFASFYKSLFDNAYLREGENVVFREHAWSMANCDPCVVQTLTPQELLEAGAFWILNNQQSDGSISSGVNQNVFLTRLHVRYTRDKFPEDLIFQETDSQTTFQGRYILTHPYKGKGSSTCPNGKEYQKRLPALFAREARNLARLTGWNTTEIQQKMRASQPFSDTVEPWWQKLWRVR
jgi:hypothetical protein